MIVVAQTDPDKGALGFSLLVVERGMEGFERGRKLDKIGLDAQDTAELSFTDVKVPAENLLGEEGSGFVYLMQNLPQERISIAVMAAAAMEAVLEETRCNTPRSARHSANRSAVSRTAGSCWPNWPPRPPQCGSWSTSSSSCISRRNSPPSRPRWPSGTRTEKQVQLIDRCLQLHGGYGYMREYPVARAYLDARVQTIYGGTTEIMKEIIGRSLGV